MSEPLNTGDLEAPRYELMAKGLDVADLSPDPMVQFAHWYQLALRSPIRLPDAMTLATATFDGKPSARMVLLKGFDARGFVFFTNYESRKGEELAENPHAALVLFWRELERQVRIEGTVEKTSNEDSDMYFQSRPWGSRISASISRQSMVIPGRQKLDEQFESVHAAHPDEQLPRPDLWGGFRVIPSVIEFWQGRANRLHDRFRYSRTGADTWRIERLSP